MENLLYREMDELSYKRKRSLRGKNRRIRVSSVYDMDNIIMADREARKNKRENKGVRIFDKEAEKNMQKLSDDIKNFNFHTSPGHECIRLCPCGKSRLLHKLPYFPDHIMHHALMHPLMPILEKSYFHDSSASIKGRGMIYAAKRIARFIDENKDAGRLYYGKLDFVKFYHNIDQQKIYDVLAAKFSDCGIRYLIHETVSACDKGLGIGLYPVQPFANFYTSSLCRDVMASFRVRVFIYCDDIAVMGRDKKEVWRAINYIQDYAEKVMCQPLHANVGVQIIDESHCMDMVGYRFFFNHTLLRKRIMKNFFRKVNNLKEPLHRYQALQSYKGWLMHCDGFRLWCKTTGMKSFKEMKVPVFVKKDTEGCRILDGRRVSASMLTDRELIFRDVEFDVKGKYKKNTCVVQVEDNGKVYKFFTCNQKLIEALKYINSHDDFPFKATLVRVNDSGLPDYTLE